MSENEQKKGKLHPLNPTRDPDVQEGIVKYFAERREQEKKAQEERRKKDEEEKYEIHTSGGTVKGTDKQQT